MIEQERVNPDEDLLLIKNKSNNYWVIHKAEEAELEEVRFQRIKDYDQQLQALQAVAHGLCQLHNQGMFYSTQFNPKFQIALKANFELKGTTHKHYVLITNDKIKPQTSIVELQQGIKRDNNNFLELIEILLKDYDFRQGKQFQLISSLLTNFLCLKKNIQSLFKLQEVLDILQFYRNGLKTPIQRRKAAIIELSRHICSQISQIQKQEIKKQDQKWLAIKN